MGWNTAGRDVGGCSRKPISSRSAISFLIVAELRFFSYRREMVRDPTGSAVKYTPLPRLLKFSVFLYSIYAPHRKFAPLLALRQLEC